VASTGLEHPGSGQRLKARLRASLGLRAWAKRIFNLANLTRLSGAVRVGDTDFLDELSRNRAGASGSLCHLLTGTKNPGSPKWPGQEETYQKVNAAGGEEFREWNNPQIEAPLLTFHHISVSETSANETRAAGSSPSVAPRPGS
jgi:hypothetical protein